MAAPPVLEHFHPAGLPRGLSHTVHASGKFDTWPVQVWVDRPGIEFIAQTNKGTFLTEVSCQAEAGPALVRFHTEEGASEPRIFVVGDDEESFDQEPNHHFRTPQVITNLPVTINGRLDTNGDVDCFSVQVAAGEWFHARADSYTLMGKADLVFRLLDAEGHELAWNHDGATTDPQLSWRSPRSQEVVLQVFGFRYPADAAIRLTGGEGAVYRLHVATGAHSAIPGMEGLAESEPSRDLTVAPRMDLPGSVQGVMDSDRDEDRFQFEGQHGDIIEAAVKARAFGSPLDAWLRLETTAGQQLAFNDDASHSPDPRIEWSVPSNGVYVAVVGSTTHRGGGDFTYQLTLSRVLPAFEVRLPASSVVLTNGSTNDVKLTVVRLRGHTNELTAGFLELPHGVSSSSLTIPPEAREVTLHLTAAPDAPASRQPVHVMVRDSVTGEQRRVLFPLTSRGENNGVPEGYSQLLIEETGDLWLTVRAPPDKEQDTVASKAD
jgi:hypothetical protein